MYISSNNLLVETKNHSEQTSPIRDITPLFSAIQEENIIEFSEKIKNIDINSYFNYEGSETLISAFLLGFFTNPDIKNGEQFIYEILAQSPSLDLPYTNDGSTQSIKDALKFMREDFLKELDDCQPNKAEFLNICLSRIEIIMNYPQRKSANNKALNAQR